MYGREGFGDRGNSGGFGGNGGGNRGFSSDRTLTPPVREGEEVDVTVEAVGEKGDGIAKVKGFVIFVPGTKAGERVRVKISRVLQKVGFGQVIGPALTAAGVEAPRAARKAEPEFDPKEELDSENFGEEPASDESMGDDADDESEDEEEAK